MCSESCLHLKSFQAPRYSEQYVCLTWCQMNFTDGLILMSVNLPHRKTNKHMHLDIHLQHRKLQLCRAALGAFSMKLNAQQSDTETEAKIKSVRHTGWGACYEAWELCTNVWQTVYKDGRHITPVENRKHCGNGAIISHWGFTTREWIGGWRLGPTSWERLEKNEALCGARRKIKEKKTI